MRPRPNRALPAKWYAAPLEITCLKKGCDSYLEAYLPRISVSLIDENGDHLRYVAQSEARKMVSTGEAVQVCRNCERAAKKYCGAHGKTHSVAFQVTALHRNTHNSPCQLTAGEMLANVGLSMRDEANHGISLGRERSAMSKVQVWPYIGDTRAVRVSCAVAL